ncbi:MFS transporter [Rhodococcus sp. NPDC057297]|uniref:MFS transporter n=1 Tax=Rhodococcus sp. NPDC057297 TaxID=3346090 RepID=UPI0036458AA9
MPSLMQTRRASIASSIGTTIEYYDFFIYGISAAFVFNKVFFSALSPAVATMVSFGTFAIAFAARPLGAIVIGHFGDRVGRKKMLIFTLMAMGIATAMIGFLPTYDQIGVAAPIMLVVLRLVQGFALGGEYGGAVLMAMEHTPEVKRSFYGSWVQVGAPIGTILANFVFMLLAFLPDAAFQSWGWRIPFFLSVALIILGYFIRNSLHESPSFEKVQNSQQVVRKPIVEVLQNHWVPVLKIAGSSLGGGVIFYVLTVYALSHGEDHLGFSRSNMLAAVIAMLGLAIPLMFVSGALADRYGRRNINVIGHIGITALVLPWALFFETRALPLMLAGYLCIAVPYSMLQGTSGVFYAEAFPPAVRYSGISLGYTVGMVFGSSIAPMIATFLYDRVGSLNAIVIYMLVIGVISTASAASIRPAKAVVAAATTAKDDRQLAP